MSAKNKRLTASAIVTTVNELAVAPRKERKERKKPELNFLSESGDQMTLLVAVGDDLVPMKVYCKQNGINFGGLKRRLLKAGRVDRSKPLLKIEANDPILVQASMRSSSLRVVAISAEGNGYHVYSSDLAKLPESTAFLVDIRNRRLSTDGGVTWKEFVQVEGADQIKRPESKPRKKKQKGEVVVNEVASEPVAE